VPAFAAAHLKRDHYPGAMHDEAAAAAFMEEAWALLDHDLASGEVRTALPQ
jgi:hypothetical protein